MRIGITQENNMVVLVPDVEAMVWQEMFGRPRMEVWHRDFNLRLFPLGVDKGEEVQEYSFGRIVTGREALAKFALIKREPVSLGAQGRYLLAHPEAPKRHPLVGIGATWKDTLGNVFFPVYYVSNDQLCVWLSTMDDKFRPFDDDHKPLYRFLIRKEKGI
jgi:hypothetical protein